jgi:ABC-type transport system substrate-binding protein
MSTHDEQPGQPSHRLRNQLSRRSVLALLISSASATLLTACGLVAPSAPAPTSPAKPVSSGGATAVVAPTAPSAAPTPAAAQPRSGGTLRTAILGDLPSLDVHFVSPNQIENLWLVFDRLISYDDALNPQPQLAESWDVGGDYKRIKLNLRKGVQFHTGREFTSDDVKYN